MAVTTDQARMIIELAAAYSLASTGRGTSQAADVIGAIGLAVRHGAVVLVAAPERDDDTVITVADVPRLATRMAGSRLPVRGGLLAPDATASQRTEAAGYLAEYLNGGAFSFDDLASRG